ncbi:MAG: hypothetical protein OEZ59_09920 [Deltaproteobacteria bacterium]|nr:hypothetical protein [Deltaproteobacteria bacterium]
MALAACSRHYVEGKALEEEKRWEEASIQYHLAVVGSPNDEDYREALDRANKVVARENMERYRNYLALKEFRKAYHRLKDALRQDPSLQEAQKEMDKWLRVLVAGQVVFKFEDLGDGLRIADEVILVARINSPNPGQILDAEIDIDTGVFFVEDLLYDRPAPLLTYYSLNSVGVKLVRKKSQIQRFRTTDFKRFVNFRTPIIDRIEGRLDFSEQSEPEHISTHRKSIVADNFSTGEYLPDINPHYEMRIEQDRVKVISKDRSDFTPVFLYINRRDRRIFADFGRYQIQSKGKDSGSAESRKGTWSLNRLSLKQDDHFQELLKNVALAPYFFYRGQVYRYEVR